LTLKEVNLKIAETENRINLKEQEIAGQKDKIAEFIRLLYQTGQKTPIEILLANDAFSEFFDQAQYLETVEQDLSTILKKLKSVKEKLDQEQKDLESERAELNELKDQLVGAQMGLEEKVTAKNVILEATQADEEKFQALLKQVRAEQAQINSDIVTLEKKLRAKL